MPTKQYGETAVSGVGRRRIGLYALLMAGCLLPRTGGDGRDDMIKTRTRSSDAPFSPPGGDGFTLDALTTAWNTLRPGLVNSLLMAIPATIVSALLGSMTAYGLTTISWRGQVGVVVLIIAGIFIPYQSVLVPLARSLSGASGLLTASSTPSWVHHGRQLQFLAVTDTCTCSAVDHTHRVRDSDLYLLFRSYYQSSPTR